MPSIFKSYWLQFFLWLAVFTPPAWASSQWPLLQVLVLMMVFVFGIGFFFLKEYKKYLPATAAFVLAMLIGIFIPPLLGG